MDTAAAASHTAVLGFEDGVGRRYLVDTGSALDARPEILCFRHELTEIPSFEFALRERVAHLSDFHHSYYARIRRVERLNDGRRTLALVSECTPGIRLAEMLDTVQRDGLILDINAALCLARQLVAAASLLHQNTQVAHGAIGPERLIVTPQGRIFIVEYVLGSALEQLRYSRERYWQDLRVALPPSAGLPRFDNYVDITQFGVVALSLILGRRLKDDEYPGKVEELIESATASSERGQREPITSGLRDWLRRALQLDVRNSFRSAAESQSALDELLSEETYTADPTALSAFLTRYRAATNTEVKAAPRPPTTDDAIEVVESDRRSEMAETAAAPVPVVERYTPPPPVEGFEAPPARHDTPPQSSGADASSPRDSDIDAEAEANWLSGLPQAQPHGHHAKTDFFNEEVPAASTAPKRAWRSLAAAVLGLAALGGALFAGQHYLFTPSTAATTGTLAINTNPPGAQVTIDGQSRGLTPVSVSLPPGAHTVVVQGHGEPRTIPVTIAAGTSSVQYLELPTKPSVETGELQVSTEPTGARVVIDGQLRGNTPLAVGDLTAGQHAITLETDLGSVSQTVMIEAGRPTSLVVPLAPKGAPVSGWMSVSAPVDMELFERGRLLGTSGIDRIMLPAGRHDIEIVNEVIGYRGTRVVNISPGKVSSIAVEMPKGTISLNATPWATVFIDGQNVGETPIGNLAIPIGPHEIVFRNPELGEQRRAVTVTTRAGVRLSVDMRTR
jgi:hypothetical protein